MIRSFRCKDTERLYRDTEVRRLASIERAARRKLLLLVDKAKSMLDLRNPPGNRLEALTGDRRGQYRIRINDQWRICFRWSGRDAFEVEIVDYHR